MSGYEKLLTFLFRLNGCFLLLATFAIFLPTDWMVEIGKWIGLGEIQMQPITVYLARSTSLLYAVHGFLTLWVGLHLRKYWDLVPVFAGLHIVMGIVLLGIDLNSGLPWYWTAAEGIPISCFGAFLFWLYTKCNELDRSAETTAN